MSVRPSPLAGGSVTWAVAVTLLVAASGPAGAAEPRFELEGLLMLDLSGVDGLYAVDADRYADSGVRRARLGAKGEVAPRWELGLEIDVEPEDGVVELHEASVGYRRSGDDELVLGLIKQPFGMENSSGSSRLRTLERSMATNAFAPDRGIGLVWEFDASSRHAGIGAFVDPEAREARGVAGRLTWAPIDAKRRVVHLGASAAYRDNAGAPYRIRDEGGLALGDNVVRSGRFAPDAVSTFGLEAGWARGSLSVQTEWFGQRLRPGNDEGADSPFFDGGYVQGSWVLGGGRRKYSKGRFGGSSAARAAPSSSSPGQG